MQESRAFIKPLNVECDQNGPADELMKTLLTDQRWGEFGADLAFLHVPRLGITAWICRVIFIMACILPALRKARASSPAHQTAARGCYGRVRRPLLSHSFKLTIS